MRKRRGLKGKKAFITGGSSGIGLATGELLARNGAEVFIASRDQKKLAEAENRIRNCSGSGVMDVTDRSSVIQLTGRYLENNGPPDILVNSAGMACASRLEEMPDEVIYSTLETNLLGTILTTRCFLDDMKKGSSIVNIGSIAGFLGLYGYTVYSASKFGITGFSESLRMELRPRGINVSIVMPPDTDTPQLEKENRTKPETLKKISGSIKPIAPEKVAGSVLKAIETGRFMVIPTFSGKLTYAVNRIFPGLTRRYLDRKIG